MRGILWAVHQGRTEGGETHSIPRTFPRHKVRVLTPERRTEKNTLAIELLPLDLLQTPELRSLAVISLMDISSEDGHWMPWSCQPLAVWLWGQMLCQEENGHHRRLNPSYYI